MISWPTCWSVSRPNADSMDSGLLLSGFIAAVSKLLFLMWIYYCSVVFVRICFYFFVWISFCCIFFEFSFFPITFFFKVSTFWQLAMPSHSCSFSPHQPIIGAHMSPSLYSLSASHHSSVEHYVCLHWFSSRCLEDFAFIVFIKSKFSFTQAPCVSLHSLGPGAGMCYIWLTSSNKLQIKGSVYYSVLQTNQFKYRFNFQWEQLMT